MVKSCFHCAWSGSFDINELWCKNKESAIYNQKVNHQEQCEKWTKFVYTSKDDIKPGQLALIDEKDLYNAITT